MLISSESKTQIHVFYAQSIQSKPAQLSGYICYVSQTAAKKHMSVDEGNKRKGEKEEEKGKGG